MGEAALVTNPDLVNRLVLARHDALDHSPAAGSRLAARAHGGIAADRAMRANTGHRVQLPRPRLKTKVDRGQRANGTDVGRVAAPIAVKAGIRESDDLQPAAAIVKMDNRIIDDLRLEASAAGALDTTFAVEDDQFTQRNLLVEPLSIRDRDRLRAFAESIVARLLHEPTLKLRRDGETGDGHALANAVHELFRLEAPGSQPELDETSGDAGQQAEVTPLRRGTRSRASTSRRPRPRR